MEGVGLARDTEVHAAVHAEAALPAERVLLEHLHADEGVEGVLAHVPVRLNHQVEVLVAGMGAVRHHAHAAPSAGGHPHLALGTILFTAMGNGRRGQAQAGRDRDDPGRDRGDGAQGCLFHALTLLPVLGCSPLWGALPGILPPVASVKRPLEGSEPSRGWGRAAPP
ncbi:hypothetical protein D3C72_1654000 [compost metagenome]